METEEKKDRDQTAEDNEPEDITASEESTTDSEQNLNKSALPGRIILFIFGHKWLWVLAVGLVLIPLGLSTYVKPNWPEAKKLFSSPPAKTNKINKNLREEWLAPFFIPLPPSASNQVIRVDLSVIWDGLASVRFKQKQIPIRNHLYRYMLNLAKKGEDFNEKLSFLEDEMSLFVRDSLETGELTVRIQEINYI